MVINKCLFVFFLAFCLLSLLYLIPPHHISWGGQQIPPLGLVVFFLVFISAVLLHCLAAGEVDNPAWSFLPLMLLVVSFVVQFPQLHTLKVLTWTERLRRQVAVLQCEYLIIYISTNTANNTILDLLIIINFCLWLQNHGQKVLLYREISRKTDTFLCNNCCFLFNISCCITSVIIFWDTFSYLQPWLLSFYILRMHLYVSDCADGVCTS